MNLPKDAIVWFEIPVLDFERARKFYSSIYDFEMTEQQMGTQQMGFFKMDQDKQGIGGAIVQGEGYTPGTHGVKIYLHGGYDLAIILNRIESVGGKVIVPKTKINDEIGFFAVFEDTEGNHINLHSRN